MLCAFDEGEIVDGDGNRCWCCWYRSGNLSMVAQNLFPFFWNLSVMCFDEDDVVDDDAVVVDTAVEIFQLLPGGSDVQYLTKCNQSNSFVFSEENLIIFW